MSFTVYFTRKGNDKREFFAGELNKIGICGENFILRLSNMEVYNMGVFQGKQVYGEKIEVDKLFIEKHTI